MQLENHEKITLIKSSMILLNSVTECKKAFSNSLTTIVLQQEADWSPNFTCERDWANALSDK